MPVDTRVAREREAMRRQVGSHLGAGEQPNAVTMGAESAEYTEPTIDPQWIDAWKLFHDHEDKEFGVPVRLPRKQWSEGGLNALEHQRHLDGRYWFTLLEPERVQPDPAFECFVGTCTKRLRWRTQLVAHVRTFHFSEAETYKVILAKIEDQVAQEDPRLQKVLASLEEAAGQVEPPNETATTCEKCQTTSPAGHASPEAWLRGHMLGAHKEGGG